MLEKQSALVESFTQDLGRAGLHKIFPNDFEYYAIAFEILNYQGESIAYFGMPIMPNSLNISISSGIDVSMTSAGVESIVNPSFIPFDITGIGSFGRALKLVTQDNILPLRLSKEFFSAKLKNIKDIVNGNEATFSNIAKTGYGLCKILEAIFALSSMVGSDGQPYIAVMYNLSFNHNYVVELMNVSFSQDVSTNNAMWNYNFTIKATAPLKSLDSLFADKRSVGNVIKNTVVRNGINTLGKAFKQYTPTFLKFI